MNDQAQIKRKRKTKAVFPSGQIGRSVIYRFVDRSGPVASEKAALGIDRPGQCLKKLGYLWISVDIYLGIDIKRYQKMPSA
jgi:hypothetical protein